MPPEAGATDDPREWLNRAQSNLERARADANLPDVHLEDLYLDAQQAGEKALKALLIHLEVARTAILANGRWPQIRSAVGEGSARLNRIEQEFEFRSPRAYASDLNDTDGNPRIDREPPPFHHVWGHSSSRRLGPFEPASFPLPACGLKTLPPKQPGLLLDVIGHSTPKRVAMEREREEQDPRFELCPRALRHARVFKGSRQNLDPLRAPE
ncbi:MAG: HEPN domain-containing protein [Acidobacteria bacterium]|nr:HEPN domain-containing protein [Acidobacteriota bacterium]